jgi:hypothetical protein
MEGRGLGMGKLQGIGGSGWGLGVGGSDESPWCRPCLAKQKTPAMAGVWFEAGGSLRTA